MTLVCITRAPEHVEALAEPGIERFGREKLRAGSSKLERERQSIEALAEPLHCLGRLDVRANRASALEEEGDRVVVHEWWQVDLVLSGDSQRLATGDEKPDGGGSLRQLCEGTGDGGKQ